MALVGDTAFAPSLFAGQGAALAIAGARVLAGELAGTTSVDAALARYESRLRPLLERKQRAALAAAETLAPRTPFGILARNQLARMLAIPGVAKLALRATVLDRFDVPEYSTRVVSGSEPEAAERERAGA